MNHVHMPSRTQAQLILLSLFFIGVIACSGSDSANPPPPTPPTLTGTPGAEEAVGERLFIETRFAQAFKVLVDNGGSEKRMAAETVCTLEACLLGEAFSVASRYADEAVAI